MDDELAARKEHAHHVELIGAIPVSEGDVLGLLERDAAAHVVHEAVDAALLGNDRLERCAHRFLARRVIRDGDDIGTG